MNWSVFTTVLNNIQEYVRKYTPISLYVPVVAFAGAWVLIGIALFGFEAPSAYWNQLSLGLKAVLGAAIVSAVLFLAYLMSLLRILIIQLYEGRWPIPGLTDLRRKHHLKKWRTLNEQWLGLAEMEEELKRLEQDMAPSVQVNIPVPKRDLPIYHIIRSSSDLTTTTKLDEEVKRTEEVKGTLARSAHELLGNYTLGSLSKDKPVPLSHVRAGPWPGYLEGRAAVSVPLVPHAALGTQDNVQAGDLIHLILTPTVADHPSWRRRRWARPHHPRARSPQVFRHVLVLGVESAKEVVPVDSTAGVSRDLVVLVVALPTDIQPRLAELLDTCEVKIVRALESWNRWSEGRVPRRLSLTEPGVTYKLPPGGVQAGDVIDIQGIKVKRKKLLLEACFVYAADRGALTVAIPRDDAASYDNWKPTGTIVLTPARFSDVPFLKRDVDKDYVLMEDDLYTREVPASDLPAGAVTELDDLVNRRALMDMAAGTCVRIDQVEEVTWLGGKLDHTRRPEVLTVTPPAASEIQVDPGDVIKVQLQKTNPESQDVAFEQCFVYAVEPQKDGSKKLTVAIPKDARLPGDLSDSSITVTPAITITPAVVKVPVLKRDVVLKGELIRAEDVEEKTFNRGRVKAGAAKKKDEVEWHHAGENLLRQTFILKNKVKAIEWLAKCEEKSLKGVDLKVPGADRLEVGQEIAIAFGPKPPGILKAVWTGIPKILHREREQEPTSATAAENDNKKSIVEPCFIKARVPPKPPPGTVTLTLAVPKGATWPSLNDQTVSAILRVGSEYEKRLQPLKKGYEKQRKKLDRFVTELFTDHWSLPELAPLRELAKKLAALRQDMKDYREKWPGLLDEIYEQLNRVQHGKVGYIGLGDLRDDLARAIETRRELLDKEIKLYYPGVREEEVMATALGNILKATEHYPLENYGIEADLIWPRLRDALQSDTTKEAIAEGKNQLDMLLLMSFLSWIFWIPASVLLALFSSNWGAFLACFWGAPLLGWLCYKAAIQKALDYGENLKTIYDLHRWDLLKEFNLDLGKELTPKEEKEVWERISALLARKRPSEPWLKDYKLKLEG
jgi:flagella basal body P-ring formation protein FlgA